MTFTKLQYEDAYEGLAPRPEHKPFTRCDPYSFKFGVGGWRGEDKPWVSVPTPFGRRQHQYIAQ